MKVKQLRFRHILVSSDKLAFKGFVLKNGSSIVNVDYTVIKSQPLFSGTLQQLIIKTQSDYSILNDIVFDAVEVHKKSFELIVDLAAEVDFDNIQCVCGSDERKHFKNLTVDYKDSTGSWTRFNYPSSIPVFKPNDIGTGYSTYVEAPTAYNVNKYNTDSTKVASSALADYGFIYKNSRRFKTGKHLVEVTLKNSDKSQANSYNNAIAIMDADSPNYNAFGITNFFRGYFVGSGNTGIQLFRVATSYTALATIGQGYPNGTIWPEMTIGLLVDLDESKIKYVYNGVNESQWFPFIKTKADQEYFFLVQIRNMGLSNEYTINYPPKYNYVDVTPEWNTRHFMTTDGWVRKYAISVKKGAFRRTERSYMAFPWTLKNRGVFTSDIKYLASSPTGIGRISDYDESMWGHGYFKNSVFIDYPPKQPTSKRVMLFSINDNQLQQLTWSNPLTGEFEFKYVKMGQPYLIITYDSDEDYNGVTVGPVYPTIMPKYVGVDTKRPY